MTTTLARIRIRRATGAQWISANPILGDGEITWETDTGMGKVGDGTSTYTELAYAFHGGGTGAVDSVNGHTGVVVLTATDVSAVPTSRTVAGKALTSNITIGLADLSAPTADFSLASHKLTNVTNPTSAQDVATKSYVDTGLGDKLDTTSLSAEALTQFTALMVPVAYDSGWPSLPSGLTSNAAIGFHFIGGPDSDPPPSVSGPAVWDATS